MTDLSSETRLLGALVAGHLLPDAVPAAQWPGISVLAMAHGLGPILHWTLRQAGYSPQVSPAWEPLVRARHQAAMDWALKERALLEVDAALRDAGILALWLKGAILAQTVYPEPSLRPMSDLDVLVPYEQREAALQVARALGYDFYTLAGITSRSTGDPLTLRTTVHHYHLHGSTANCVVLELHFRLLGHDDLLSLEQLEWFLSQQHTVTLDNGATFGTFTPEAHLLYLAAHAVLQHGEANPYLLRYFDFHQLLTRTPVDWDVVLDQAVALEWTFVLERALRHAVETFATPVPAHVFAALVERRPAHEDTQRVLRLQRPGHRWEHLQRTLAHLSTADRLRLLPRVVCPAPSYMRQRYHIRAGVPTWPYYFYRWFDQGRDVANALWNRVTNRRTA